MSSIDDEELDRSQYFVDTIQDHLLCPICSGVFTKPVVLSCCGQSLCENCLLKSMESCDKCPMCRREEQTTVPFVQNRVVDDHIQAMKVKCMNNKDPNACDCSWTGQVSEWKNHVDNECEICEISCPVAGCDFKGRRRDMVAHNSTNIMHHTRLLIDAEVADHETKHEKQIKDLNKNCSSIDSKIMDLHKNHKNETANLIKKHEQMDGKITDHETKHEKQIKDLNEKISNMDSKIIDLQKNHKNGIKKLKNEIIKKDAKTDYLIKKYEQMDEQMTNFETKHEKEIKDLNEKICSDHNIERTSIGAKLDLIETGMTALQKETRILKRKISDLGSASDNVIGKNELNVNEDLVTDKSKNDQQHPHRSPSKQRLSFPVVLYQKSDEHKLTAYECLLLKQLELFEADEDDVRFSTGQGGSAPIKLGQVGIRCRHCAVAELSARITYYPHSVEGIYKLAQNISKHHLCTHFCYRTPRDVRCQLIALQRDYRRGIGGKEYWSKKIRSLGVYLSFPISIYSLGILRVKCGGPKEEKKEEGQNGEE